MSLDLSARKMREASRPVMLDDGSVDIDAIDFSSVEMWLKCGQQYRFRWVEGRREPPSVALAEGIGHHDALEKDNKRKMKQGKAYGWKALVDRFVGKFRGLIPEYEKQCDEAKTKLDWQEEAEDDVIRRAKAFHQQYTRTHSPKIEPVMVEETMSKEVGMGPGSFRIFGQLDVATKKKVIDYKVTGRARPQSEVDQSLQLSLYSELSGRNQVQIVNFVKSASPYVKAITSRRDEGRRRWALNVVASAVRAIRSGQFPLARPDPQTWWCSAKWCGYWKRCRGRYEK